MTLLTESEGDLQRVINYLYSVCNRRKHKVNAGKSKVIVLKRRGEEVIDFKIAYSRGTQLAEYDPILVCDELVGEPQHLPVFKKKKKNNNNNNNNNNKFQYVFF